MTRRLLLPFAALALAVAALLMGASAEAQVEEGEEEYHWTPLSRSDIRMLNRYFGHEGQAWQQLAIDLGVIGVVSADAFVAEPMSIERFRDLDRPLTGTELRQLLELTGFRGEGLRQSWAVAMKESTGHPLAHNTNRATGDNSYGLFQINMLGKLGPYRLEKFDLPSYEALFDPVTNAEVAYHMSNEGTNFGHWGIGPDAYEGSTLGSYPRWYEDFHEEAYTDE